MRDDEFDPLNPMGEDDPDFDYDGSYELSGEDLMAWRLSQALAGKNVNRPDEDPLPASVIRFDWPLGAMIVGPYYCYACGRGHNVFGHIGTRKSIKCVNCQAVSPAFEFYQSKPGGSDGCWILQRMYTLTGMAV